MPVSEPLVLNTQDTRHLGSSPEKCWLVYYGSVKFVQIFLYHLMKNLNEHFGQPNKLLMLVIVLGVGVGYNSGQ